jgi:hypothetical protein
LKLAWDLVTEALARAEPSKRRKWEKSVYVQHIGLMGILTQSKTTVVTSTLPEDAPAEVLRLSLHAGDDTTVDAATAKVRLWAARWENTPPTDYLGLLRRWLTADGAEAVRLRRLSDAAWAVDALRELTAGRAA